MMSRRPLALLLLLALPAFAACEQRTETRLAGHTIRNRDVAKLSFGHSTGDDVERLFGAPDERAADGSLVYRASAVRQTARTIAGWTVAGDAEIVGRRTATFRFQDGVLARICRDRS